MQQTHNTDEISPSGAAPTQFGGTVEAALDAMNSAGELSALLARAGKLAASMGVNLDTWMKEAWSAYVDAQPGLREHIEDMQLLAQLSALRESGKMAQS